LNRQARQENQDQFQLFSCSSWRLGGSIIVLGLLGDLGVLGGSVLDLIPALFLSVCSAVQV
jgi:hypothetical protein